MKIEFRIVRLSLLSTSILRKGVQNVLLIWTLFNFKDVAILPSKHLVGVLEILETISDTECIVFRFHSISKALSKF